MPQAQLHRAMVVDEVPPRTHLTPMPDVPSIADRLRQRMMTAPGLSGLYLAGSHGSGHADRFSDVDFVAVVEDTAHEDIAEAWRTAVEAEETVVFWFRAGRGPVLLNAVTEDWLRIDLITNGQELFLKRRQADIVPVHDPAGLHSRLDPSAWVNRPDAARVSRIIEEFVRVLGLMPVALGRDELFVCVTGSDLLRTSVKDLLIARDALVPPGGALHLTRVLPPEDIDLLNRLPFPRPDRAEVVAAIAEIARVFFPIARAMARDLDIAWPAAFEAAARNHLRREVPEFDTDWG
ncbi:MAG: aminoglycoside 6-adenylyltransferase [Pseudomonadota bacterium]